MMKKLFLSEPSSKKKALPKAGLFGLFAKVLPCFHSAWKSFLTLNKTKDLIGSMPVEGSSCSNAHWSVNTGQEDA